MVRNFQQLRQVLLHVPGHRGSNQFSSVLPDMIVAKQLATAVTGLCRARSCRQLNSLKYKQRASGTLGDNLWFGVVSYAYLFDLERH